MHGKLTLDIKKRHVNEQQSAFDTDDVTPKEVTYDCHYPVSEMMNTNRMKAIRFHLNESIISNPGPSFS